ncbi:hypothetical protein ACFQH9_15900 [Pseudonocardia lutea]|uniref:Uncharacterized protein n=1 Tax=Pseudonocardia lutea TaxID=2172015 RepID=A0ABW1IAH9_9PSEU
MTAGGEGSRKFVLAVEDVRSAIAALQARRIHPFFPAYLHLRKLAVSKNSNDQLRPDWSELGILLTVPGGPPNKPYFRPFLERGGANRSRYWMNRNLAGSYAPSSIRGQVQQVVTTSGQLFNLKDDHARLAREYLLYDEPLDVADLVVFLYRDFGFLSVDGSTPSILDCIDIFLDDFGFLNHGARSADFRKLFDNAPDEVASSLLVELAEVDEA